MVDLLCVQQSLLIKMYSANSIVWVLQHWLPTKSKTVASNAIFGSLLVFAVIYYVFKSSPLPQRCDLMILGACLNAND